MITEQWLESHRERLLKNKQIALRMLHNVEGALSLVDALIAEMTTGPVPTKQE